jgi:hypothetical protein
LWRQFLASHSSSRQQFSVGANLPIRDRCSERRDSLKLWLNEPLHFRCESLHRLREEALALLGTSCIVPTEGLCSSLKRPPFSNITSLAFITFEACLLEVLSLSPKANSPVGTHQSGFPDGTSLTMVTLSVLVCVVWDLSSRLHH